jgi:hypothetical protein
MISWIELIPYIFVFKISKLQFLRAIELMVGTAPCLSYIWFPEGKVKVVYYASISISPMRGGEIDNQRIFFEKL